MKAIFLVISAVVVLAQSLPTVKESIAVGEKSKPNANLRISSTEMTPVSILPTDEMASDVLQFSNVHNASPSAGPSTKSIQSLNRQKRFLKKKSYQQPRQQYYVVNEYYDYPTAPARYPQRRPARYPTPTRYENSYDDTSSYGNGNRYQGDYYAPAGSGW